MTKPSFLALFHIMDYQPSAGTKLQTILIANPEHWNMEYRLSIYLEKCLGLHIKGGFQFH